MQEAAEARREVVTGREMEREMQKSGEAQREALALLVSQQ
jgi:hypothetical protein